MPGFDPASRPLKTGTVIKQGKRCFLLVDGFLAEPGVLDPGSSPR
jgi:hypothetical protein